MPLRQGRNLSMLYIQDTFSRIRLKEATPSNSLYILRRLNVIACFNTRNCKVEEAKEVGNEMNADEDSVVSQFLSE